MTTTEVRDEADGQEPGPELLALEQRPADRRVVRRLVAGAVVMALALAGFGVWQQLRPPPDFTLAQLQGAYTGMVRSDGTNDVSTIDPSKFTDPPLAVEPAVCGPLFTSTVSNQFPSPALDGVSTYWLSGNDSVSLFTVRYADQAAAEAAYRLVADAAAVCDEQTVRFSGREGSGLLHRVPVTTADPAGEQLAFRLDRTGGQGRYALHLLRLSNTVSWQYRYDARTEDYDPTSAQQLMDGLATQLLSIQQSAVREDG